jgi:hypothetical protein
MIKAHTRAGISDPASDHQWLVPMRRSECWRLVGGNQTPARSGAFLKTYFLNSTI